MTPQFPHRTEWSGQLQERHRIAIFALAAAVVLVASTALSRIDRPAPHPTRPAATTPVVARDPIAAVDARPPELRRPDRRLRRTAVRFLNGYLPYLYGQAPLRRIVAASRGLLHRLARERLRVPPAARRRRPRIRALRLGARVPDARAWLVFARIADGDVAAYPIELLIGARRDRLVVIQTGGE